MSTPDESGSKHGVATAVVDSLKGQPVLLAVLVTNLVTLAIIIWFSWQTIGKLIGLCAGGVKP